jgi:hypothetical protein
MQTALISALTATIVTLIIEYFAKPALEARKDRLVSASRARRDIAVELGPITRLLEKLSLSVDDGDWVSVDTLFKALEDKLAKLDERHVEVSNVISLSRSRIAREALAISRLAIIGIEVAIINAKETYSARGEKFEVNLENVSKEGLKIEQALRVVEVVYRQYGLHARTRRWNTKGAEQMLALIEQE